MTYQKLLDKDGFPILAQDGKPIWVFADFDGQSESYWRTTITIYNKKIDFDSRQVKWYVTIVHNCFWAGELDANIRGGGFQSYSAEDRTQHEKPSTIIRVPYKRNYQTPEEWDDYPNGFTIRPDDIIFRGIVVNAFAGKRVNDVLDEYGRDAIVVRKIKDNVRTSDFFKHIYVEGN